MSVLIASTHAYALGGLHLLLHVWITQHSLFGSHHALCTFTVLETNLEPIGKLLSMNNQYTAPNRDTTPTSYFASTTAVAFGCQQVVYWIVLQSYIVNQICRLSA